MRSGGEDSCTACVHLGKFEPDTDTWEKSQTISAIACSVCVVEGQEYSVEFVHLRSSQMASGRKSRFPIWDMFELLVVFGFPKEAARTREVSLISFEEPRRNNQHQLTERHRVISFYKC